MYMLGRSCRGAAPPATRPCPPVPDEAGGLSYLEFVDFWQGLIVNAALGALIWAAVIGGVIAWMVD